MREHLFKGMDFFSKKWGDSLEGGVADDPDNKEKGHIVTPYAEDTLWAVIAKTIGEYTGKKDCKGEKIFEHHLVEFLFKLTDTSPDTVVCLVYWDDEECGFMMKCKTGERFKLYQVQKMEIVGNIFDNPDKFYGSKL